MNEDKPLHVLIHWATTEMILWSLFFSNHAGVLHYRSIHGSQAEDIKVMLMFFSDTEVKHVRDRPMEWRTALQGMNAKINCLRIGSEYPVVFYEPDGI
jgi:hypothetical protein